MRIIARILLLVISLIFLSGCAITHKYGPFSGKVLDKDTGQPIAGIGVFVTFHTEFGFSPGGAVSSEIGAVESITNENGEFFIPAKRLYTFRVGSGWPKRCIPHFFKPGYGAYPQHKESSSNLPLEGWFEKTESNIIVKLPKLHSFTERKDNRFSLYGDENGLYVYSQYIDQQRIFMGYKPYKLNNYWRYKGLITSQEKTILDRGLYRRTYNERLSGIAGIGKGKGSQGAMVFTSPPINNPNPFSVKYKINEEQIELIKQLEKNNMKFIVEEDSTVKFTHDSKNDIDKIIKKIDNKPRIFFLSTEIATLFINSLKQSNIPYLLRTIPNVKGYDIIWDYAYDDKVEILKLELFNKIIKQTA